MMKKVTKKEINKLLTGIKHIVDNLGWSVWQIGAYAKCNEIKLYVAYHGQGLDENVYNGAYDNIVDLTDYYQDWANGVLDKKTTVDLIYDCINENLLLTKVK